MTHNVDMIKSTSTHFDMFSSYMCSVLVRTRNAVDSVSLELIVNDINRVLSFFFLLLPTRWINVRW